MADIPDMTKLLTKTPDVDLSGLVTIPIKMAPIQKSVLVESAQANYASEFHERLVKWINNFDASLDEKHEVGIRLVNFGQAVVFHLEDLGYWNPSLISFSGKTDSGDLVELIQHVSQISILLIKLPRKDPSKPKGRIGFQVVAKQEQEEGQGSSK